MTGLKLETLRTENVQRGVIVRKICEIIAILWMIIHKHCDG
jgi:hypothetical protein